LRSWHRPITEHERHAALALVVVLLAASAVLLITTRPVLPQQTPAPRATTSPHSAPASTPTSHSARVAPVAARVAYRFLNGYLAYLYGHAPARAITATTPSLLRSLRTRPPLVSPAMRARQPRVLSLRPIPVPAGAMGVSVLIGDGELADYSVGLLLKREHRQLLVSSVEGD
jgi:hypothetical protein